jgi:hypothetical protein
MATIMLPELVIYADVNFGGTSFRTNLAFPSLSGNWNDSISSVIVVSGTWQFFRHINFQAGPGDGPWILKRGFYKFLPEAGIPNDEISSFRPIDQD